MSNFLRIAVIALIFVACRKSDVFTETSPQAGSKMKPQSCDFGIIEFNTVKRPARANNMNQQELSPSQQPDAVLFLDFNGHTVSNTSWNINGDIVCSPSNLSSTEMAEIINRVSEDFSPFDILVTANESIYNGCNPYRRMRVIITETWEWFGQAGGVAFINSFTWGNNTPCFVFSVLLNYNIKKIAEAVSHEAGHTLGLYHQSLFDPSCFLFSAYYSGQGTGELSWAPIMGLSYYRNMTTWRRGSNIYGCNNIQDDILIISGKLSFNNDDHSNQFNQATNINSGWEEGRINNSLDIDFFRLNLSASSSIVISPFHVNINNEGANVDMKVRIYTQDRNLLSTHNDPNSLSISTTLSPGRYYISVESTENINSDRYGQLGNYSITVN